MDIKNETPLVSVIITTHNGSNNIERAVKSVLNQNYGNYEIIVVDDNGYRTEEQIETEKIVRKFPEVRYIYHEKNKNGSVARNTGAANANGKYLSFLDDDDEYLPNKLSLQVKKFNDLDEEYGLVYCSFKEDKRKGVPQTIIADRRGMIVKYSLLDQVKIATSLFMVRKSVFIDLGGFDESFRRHQDWEFVARLTSRYKADFVPEVCVIKHSIQRNSTRDIETMEKYRLHYLKKLHDIIDAQECNKEIYCYHYLCFVKEYVKAGKYEKFFEYLFKSKAPMVYLKMFFRDFTKSLKKYGSF